MPRAERCEFCSIATPQWRYPAGSFSLETETPEPAVGVSSGDWLACEICHALIEAEDIHGLALRAATTFVEKWPITIPILHDLVVDIERMFNKFFRYRTGPPVRLR